MAEILGATMPSLPNFSMSGIGNIITYIFLLIIIAGFCGLLLYLVYQKKMYRYTIEIFENVSGIGYVRSFIDKARPVKLGDGGQMVLLLKRKKQYVSAYGKKMSKNAIWFAIGQDGLWYNFVLGDMDTKTGVIDVEPVDADVRMLYEGIRKNTEKEFSKPDNFSKYAPMIFGFLLVVAILVGGWFLIKQVGQIMASSDASIQASERVMRAAESVLSKIDVIQNGGSGIITVPTT